MRRLIDPTYMTFPFRLTSNGPATSGRSAHVREQIEQVLFTDPGERVFRPDFGGGVRRLVFESNSASLWDIARKRIFSSLVDALQGEVDPRTLSVEIIGDDGKLYVEISYRLASVGLTESHIIPIPGGEDHG